MNLSSTLCDHATQSLDQGGRHCLSTPQATTYRNLQKRKFSARFLLALFPFLMLCWGTSPLFVSFGLSQETETDAEVDDDLDPLEDTPFDSELSEDYGFLPLEVFKLSEDIEYLQSRDLNQDGYPELLVVDNEQSRIDILYQRTPWERKEKQAEKAEELQVNELPDLPRFRQEKVPVNESIEWLGTGDVNGDGWLDLIYTGDSHLFVRPGDEAQTWQTVYKLRLADSDISKLWRFTVKDLDQDGFEEVVILGEDTTRIFAGRKEMPWAPAKELSNTSKDFSMLWIVDLNQDGRLDLLFWNTRGEDHPVVVRLQDESGTFGPEWQLELSNPRAMEIAATLKLGEEEKPELLTIDEQTGRLQVSQFVETPEVEDAFMSPLVEYGFGKRSRGSSREQFLKTGDINGDDLTDIVVVHGGSALMDVYLQDEENGIREPQSFPGLTGIRSLQLADIDQDGRDEILLASDREKILAVSYWRNGRLSFPSALPTVGIPMTLTMADFEGRGLHDIAYISSGRTSTFGSSSYSLHKLHYDRDEGWQTTTFQGEESLELKDLRSVPAELLAFDADRDGRDDLMILSQNEPVSFLLTNTRGIPEPQEQRNSDRLGSVSPGQVTIGRLDGQAILLAQNNFARRVKLDVEDQWSVVDQINAESSAAKISASAILDADNDGENEIALVDNGTKQLRFYKRTEGLFRPWREVELGNFSFGQIVVADFNRDNRPDILIEGPDRFGILYAGMTGPQLQTVTTFETNLRKADHRDLVVGDLGGGAEPEIALIDMQEKRLELLSWREEAWKSVLAFKVIETSDIQGGGGSEPREIKSFDVTGDGLDDLVFIANDRILLYPQDPGPAEESE
ncbi:Hypothetical protein PBC10988_33470 [Planctomycetales bacterium 10988]|nr:Hypothetical protein PBC10988_33470 [Planctomycetales bacterium 10988]